MITAETDDERQVIRQKRIDELFFREVDRQQDVKDWEAKRESLRKDEPGIWMSKWNSLVRFDARRGQTRYDIAADTIRLLGAIFDSPNMKDSADNLEQMSRAYHKSVDWIPVNSVNWFDDMTNSFLQNSPYTGLAVATAILTPDKLTPMAIFALSAAMEGSDIKQTSLDNDIDIKSARLRGWIGGSLSGLLEAYGGGAAKYDPRKLLTRLAGFPKKLTNVVLTEIFKEEIPQEIVAMIFADDVPRETNGDIDWDGVTNRLLIIARDTAFLSSIFTTASSSIGQIDQWQRQNIMTEQMGQAMDDALQMVFEESDLNENRTVTEATETIEPQDLTSEQPAEQSPKDRIEEDELKIVTVPDTEDLDILINETPRYGVVEQRDGKFTVIDWETQREIHNDLKKKNAVVTSNELNAGNVLPPKQRIRVILPTSQDIETLNHTQLLRAVFSSVSRNARKAVVDATNAIIKSHKDLAGYASLALKGLDISRSQTNALIAKIATVKNESQASKVVETIESIREINRHQKAVAEFNKIKRFVTKASKRRLRDGGIHYKIYDALKSLLSNYTTLNARTLNSLRRTQEHFDNMRDSLATQTSTSFAEARIPKATMDRMRELTATRISDLNADEVVDLNNTLKQYLKLNQTYSHLVQNKMTREAKNFVDNANANIKLQPKPPRLRRFGFLGPIQKFRQSMIDSLVGIKNADIYTIATHIWGKFDPISRLMQQSRRKQLGLTMKYAGMIRGIVSDHNITDDQLKEWTHNMHLFVGGLKMAVKQALNQGIVLHTVNIGGTDFDFTMAELMSFVMHSRSRYNLDKMVKNGIGTRDFRVGEITINEFDEMLQIVESDQGAKAFIDSLEAFYREMQVDGNQTSRELDGINLFNEDDYFHIEYEQEGGVVGTEYVRDAIIDEEGRLKARTSSNRPVVLRDIFEVIGEDIHVISNFAGMTEGIRKMRLLANNTVFRKKLRDANAENILNEFDSRIRDIQKTRTSPNSTLERAVGKIDRGIAESILLNPKIWGLQPFSSLLYSTEVTGRYMTRIGRKLGSQFESDLFQNWILYAARKEGLGSAKSLATSSTIKKIVTGSGNFADQALIFLHRMDLVGVTRAAQITLGEMTDKGLSGQSLEWWENYGANPQVLQYGTEAFWQAFNDRADHLVTLTQPMFFAENKSTYVNSDNPLIRSLSRFRSFIDQNLRIINRQIALARQGETSKAQASKNIATALLLLSLIKPIMDALFDLVVGRKRDEGDFLRAMITSPLGLVPFVGYPAQRITTALLGGRAAVPEISAMPLMLIDSILKHSWQTAKGVNFFFDDEFIQTGKNVGKRKSEQFIKEGIKGFTSDFLMLQGVPIKTIEKIEWWKE